MILEQPPFEVPMDNNKPFNLAQMWRHWFSRLYDMSKAAFFQAKNTDPADPGRGEAVIWLSDGTGTGDDGDVMVKITDLNGTTKTTTLIDFSGL